MSTEKPKVLVVDDFPANLIAMRKLLKRLNCDVIEANSGNEALALCLNQNYALILLDVNMPEMDGYEVARLLNEEPSTQDIPIILVTAAYEDQEHQLRGYQAGAVDYIQKPVEDVIMLSKVRIFLDLYNNNRQLVKQQDSLRLAALVFENSSEGMMVTDADGIIISVNPAFTDVTGYSEFEVIGKTPRVLKSGRHDLDFYRGMWADLNSQGSWQGEIWNRRKDGMVFPEWLSINTIFYPDGLPNSRVALFADITKRKQDEELIWRQANFDPLTGLSNRRMFHDRLAMQLKESQRRSASLALLYLDLDEFKTVNDTLGHDMGDVLLKEAARRLCGCVRETDTVSRLGGDEFTIIIGQLEDFNKVERIAQSIIDILSKPFELGKDLAYISASVGITLYPDDASNLETLLKNADQAMYAAKKQGRRRFCYFTQSMQESTMQRMRMANDLREALSKQQFELHYQPIVKLINGEVHKAEALIRWQHPGAGCISPVDFIPIAEETGSIVEIGDWVFEEAVRQVRRWKVLFHPAFQISINKSPVQFNGSSLMQADWLAYLRDLGLPGDCLTVEITEGLLLDMNAAIKDKLLAYRDAGMQISIDDFGTGYSSLSYLQKFDIDYLKIDRSFVCNLDTEHKNRALCSAIIVMAHELGMQVIAEGVETESQRDFLIAAKCDYGQGYLFSRPLPAQAFEEWWERRQAVN